MILKTFGKVVKGVVITSTLVGGMISFRKVFYTYLLNQHIASHM
jgi:hypothetical protein